jgi:hypothetical protein
MSLTNITLSGNQSAGGLQAVGTILYYGAGGSPTTYKPVGNVGNIKWPLSVKTADVTNQGTNWTRSIPTLFEGGVMTCDLHWIPGSTGSDSSGAFGGGFTSGLGSVFTQGIVAPWKLIFPDGTTQYFTGYISKFPIDANLEKDLMVAMEITVMGEPIFA